MKYGKMLKMVYFELSVLKHVLPKSYSLAYALTGLKFKYSLRASGK